MRTAVAALIVALAAGGAGAWVLDWDPTAAATCGTAALPEPAAPPPHDPWVADPPASARVPVAPAALEPSARELAIRRASLAMERATVRPWSEVEAAVLPAAQERACSFELQGTYLVVRWVDADGAPWVGSPLHVLSERRTYSPLASWGRPSGLRVVPCAPRELPPADVGPALPGGQHGSDVADFAVLPGRRYLVTLLHDEFAPAAHVVDVPAQGGRVELVVRARGPAHTGRLRVRLFLPPGERGGRNVEVRLEDPATGTLVCLAPWKHETEFELRAPTGRYRLVARGRPYFDRHHGDLIWKRALGRAEVEIDVGPWERGDVVLELGRGAHLELELAGLADEADRLVVRERWGAPEDREEVLRQEHAAALALVHLVRRTGGWERVDRERTVRWGGSSTTVYNDWALGERAVSEVLSPGEWTLIARLPGGREVAADVVLRAGETTSVRLEFPP